MIKKMRRVKFISRLPSPVFLLTFTVSFLRYKIGLNNMMV